MNQLVLSIFPGIGLLDRAFEAESFVVVRGPDVIWGGDIRNFHPPERKFDGVIGGPPCQCFSTLANLVRACGKEPRFGNLIPEFERCVKESAPGWFLMENVPGAPVPVVPGYEAVSFQFDNSWLPGEDGDGLGQEQRRRRRFSFGTRWGAFDLRRWIEQSALDLPRSCRAVTQTHVNNSQEAKGRVLRSAVLGDRRETAVRIGGSGKVKRSAVTAVHSGAGRPKGGHQLRYKLGEACRLQGLPENFLEDAPFTAQGKLNAVANGVPLPLGRALARAVKRALDLIAGDT